MSDTCATCRFFLYRAEIPEWRRQFVQEGEGWGECHAGAPHLTPNPWAQLDEGEWCGEWVEKPGGGA